MRFKTLPLIITLIAGMSTAIGGAIGVLPGRQNRRFLSGALGLSAGVMAYVSLAEMLPNAMENLANGNRNWLLGVAVGLGTVGVMVLVDWVFSRWFTDRLTRTGMISAVAIAAHNLPEGLVVFSAAMYDPTFGLVIALAVALHNIPEGIAVASPIFHATGNKRQAFGYAFLSGLAEPLGGLLGWLILDHLVHDLVVPVAFLVAAAIMLYVVVRHLIPEINAGQHKLLASIWGLAGIIVMAVSLHLVG